MSVDYSGYCKALNFYLTEEDLAIFESVASRMGAEPFYPLVSDAEADAMTHDRLESALHDFMRLYTHGSFVAAARAECDGRD